MWSVPTFNNGPCHVHSFQSLGFANSVPIDTVHECTAEGMNPSVTAMGFTVHLHEARPPLIYTQLLSLTFEWTGKYSFTLQSPWANSCKHIANSKHIANIMISVVLNVQPFLYSKLSTFLSITAWCQISLFWDIPSP